MKPSRSAQLAPKPSAQPLPPATGPVRAWVHFWFTPVDPVGLHTLRLLAGLLFLTWLLPFAGHLDSLFGLQGWFDQQAYVEAARLPDGPPKPLGWSILYLSGTSSKLLVTLYGLSLGVLVLFTLGLWTRLTAVLTWIIVASFTMNPVLDYEADALLGILAFYLMVGYLLLGQRESGQTWLARLLGPIRPARAAGTCPPSLGANLALRLLQVHVAIVLVTSGLHKLQFGDWWAGVAFWYPLYPPFQTTVAAVRSHAAHHEFYLGILSVAAYLTLGWQIGFPLFAWKPGWRLVLLGGASLGWLGTAFLYRLPLLGPILLLGCLSYLTPAEWHRLIGWLTRIPGWQQLADRLRAPSEERSVPALKREESASLVTVGQR